MNHPWQQPIRPLEVQPNGARDLWIPVLFIAVDQLNDGWKVLSIGGHVYRDDEALLRVVA